MKRVVLSTLLAVGLGAMTGMNQVRSVRYAATDGELEYVSVNDYLLWFLQGADTAGQPTSTRTKELHRYSEADGLIETHVRLQGIDVAFESTQTLTIRGTGRVLAVDGVAVADAESPRVDFLPRLPESGTLEPGRTWVDTVSSAGERPYGRTHYRADRTYRVVGSTVLGGQRAVLFVGEGTLALRQGGWQNEEQGVFWWQDVTGPVTDSVWFFPETGHLARSVTSMNLLGTGGFGNGQRQVEMPSGLRSRVDRVIEAGL